MTPAFDSVVVGVSDYAGGRDAIELARVLGSRDGDIALVYVEYVAGDSIAEPLTGSDAERRRFGLERLARVRDDAQISAELSRVQAGSVRRGLYEIAASRGADLIVIGASRGTRLEHRFLGEDAREVLEDPPCAVAVAPVGYFTGSHGIHKVGVAGDGSPETEQALAMAQRIAAEHGATVSMLEAETVEGLRRQGASVDLLVLASHKHRPPARHLERSRSQRLAENPLSPLLVLASRSSRMDRRWPKTLASGSPSS